MRNNLVEKKYQEYRNVKVFDCDCGYNPVSNYLDNIYPTNRERTEYNVCCTFHNGGCGKTVYGKTVVDAIDRWNQGLNDETIY